MPSVEAETPRKMLPPPMTMPTSTPSSMTSFTSEAICCNVLGAMPYLPSPISASPLSLRRMCLNFGRFALGAVMGRGSYLASWGWSTATSPVSGVQCPVSGAFSVGLVDHGGFQKRLGRMRLNVELELGDQL